MHQGQHGYGQTYVLDLVQHAGYCLHLKWVIINWPAGFGFGLCSELSVIIIWPLAAFPILSSKVVGSGNGDPRYRAALSVDWIVMVSVSTVCHDELLNDRVFYCSKDRKSGGRCYQCIAYRITFAYYSHTPPWTAIKRFFHQVLLHINAYLTLSVCVFLGRLLDLPDICD